MAQQPRTPQAPPDLPSDPKLSPQLSGYLRNFALWCRHGFADKLDARAAVSGILLQANDGSDKVYALQVDGSGDLVLKPSTLGSGDLGAPIGVGGGGGGGAFLPLTGGTLTGELIQNATAPVATANVANTIMGQKNGLNRVALHLGDEENEGSGYGSNFGIDVYDDAGSIKVKNAFTIDRHGHIGYTGGIVFFADTASPNGVFFLGELTAPASIPTQFTLTAQYTDTLAGWWVNICDPTPRTGGNAGANFTIQPYNDSGVAMPDALTIFRANSQIKIVVPADAANDAAAATAGVPVGGIYRNGSALMVRVT